MKGVVDRILDRYNMYEILVVIIILMGAGQGRVERGARMVGNACMMRIEEENE